LSPINQSYHKRLNAYKIPGGFSTRRVSQKRKSIFPARVSHEIAKSNLSQITLAGTSSQSVKYARGVPFQKKIHQYNLNSKVIGSTI